MNLFSDERISDLAEKICQELMRKGLVKKDAKTMLVRAEVKKAYIRFYKINGEVEALARKRIASMAKPPAEGSDAWRVLYDKTFIEEWKKH